MSLCRFQPRTDAAEWEFACRAGTTSKYWTGDQDESLGQAGWFGANSGGRTHAVGELTANPLGLFDIHGNVWEWVQDWWEPTYYAQFQGLTAVDPRGPFSAGAERGIRGGVWFGREYHCRASGCWGAAPTYSDHLTGFRPALEVDAVKAAIAPDNSDAQNAVAPPPATAPFDAAAAKQHQQEWADYLGQPIETTNSIGMKLVVIPPGEFKMGEGDNAVPVTLTRPFRLGIHEVTQGQWKTLMGSEPWKGQKNVQEGEDIAAAYISWRDATDFCGKLTERERAVGKIPSGWAYRLPTEAEWENACRAGTITKYPFGDDPKQLPKFAWCEENADAVGESHARAGGLKQPNAWGLCDILGNLWEWCADSYAEKLPGGRDPLVLLTSPYRSLRGGCWDDPVPGSAARLMRGDSQKINHAGFRVVLSRVEQESPPPAVAPFDASQNKASGSNGTVGISSARSVIYDAAEGFNTFYHARWYLSFDHPWQ